MTRYLALLKIRIKTYKSFLHFSGPQKIDLKWAARLRPDVFFPTNPDLADIWGRTDLDFENLYFLEFLDSKFPDVQVPRLPGPQKSGLGRAEPGLGRASAGLRPWAGGALGWVPTGFHGFPRVSHGFPTGFHGFPRVSHGPGPRVGRALGL